MESFGKTLIVVAVSVAVLATGAITAYAHPGHHHGHGKMMIFWSMLSQDQKDQAKKIMRADRDKCKEMHERVRAAHKALAKKMFSAEKDVDVTQELDNLNKARAALAGERTNLALKVRAILSKDQLVKAAGLWTKLDALHEQEHAIHKKEHALFKETKNEPGEAAMQSQ